MTPTLKRAALMAPGLGWLALFLLVPCLLVLGLSFFERGVYGGVDYIFTFENYRRAVDPLYRSILINSGWLALLATLASALIGYPAAYAIVKAPRHRQAALLVLVMLPFWSNYLIRTYAWIVLLNREGLINRALAALGASEPLPLLYNDFAIVLGLVYGYLPFMVLAIYSSLSRLDPAFLEQSADLGASPASTFLRITLPLTLPGLAAGSIFVFVLSIGNFITPDLLGGGRRVMVGNLIYKQFLAARDWPFGSALAFLLIAVMMLLLFAQALVVRKSGGERPA
jgi:spermidine/putrescine transport system permease protein